MTPCRGNTFLFRSSQQLPRLRLGPLKGFFELTQRPSRALDSPYALLPELQRNKDTVWCATLDAEVPGNSQELVAQALLVRLLKTHFFVVPKRGGLFRSQNYLACNKCCGGSNQLKVLFADELF